eukprot:gene9836-11651_t
METVRALREEAARPSKLSVWIDLFSVNHHLAVNQEYDYWSETIPQAVRSIGRTVVVLSPGIKPNALSRGWCLYEMSVTLEVEAPLELRLPPSEVAAFTEMIHGGNFKLKAWRRNLISITDTLSRESRDRARIMEILQDKLGIPEWDARLSTVLGKWLEVELGRALAGMTGEQQLVSGMLSEHAMLLTDLGELAQAEPMLLKLTNMAQADHGLSHPATLGFMDRYANVLKGVGKRNEAAEMFVRVLEGREAQGVPTLKLRLSMLALAELHHDQGQFRKAEELYRKLLNAEDDEDENQEVLKGTAALLAEVLQAQNQFEEPVSLLRETLEVRAVELGDDHLDTLTSQHGLAVTLLNAGATLEGEEWLRSTLAVRLERLGVGHVDTLLTLKELTTLLAKNFVTDEADYSGAFEDLDALYRKMLTGQREQLGSSHPETLDTLVKLGLHNQRQRKLHEAEKFLREVLRERRALHGPSRRVSRDQDQQQHLEVLETTHMLASLLHLSGKLVEAKKLFQETVQGRQVVFGSDHPLTLEATDGLLMVLIDMDETSLAVKVGEQLVTVRQDALGLSHPETLESMNKLTIMLLNNHQVTLAESLGRATLEKRLEALGDKHQDSLTSMANLASVLVAKGHQDMSEAKKLNERAYEGRRATLGDDHLDTGDSAYNLAQFLEQSYEFLISAKMYETAAATYSTAYGTTHDETLDAQAQAWRVRRMKTQGMGSAIKKVLATIKLNKSSSASQSN